MDYYSNYDNASSTLKSLIERLTVIDKNIILRGNLLDNALFKKVFLHLLNSKFNKKYPNIKKNVTQEIKHLMDIFFYWGIFPKIYSEKYSTTKSKDGDKFSFLMNEIIQIFKKDTDGAYALIDIVKDIFLPDVYIEEIKFYNSVIIEKWPKVLNGNHYSLYATSNISLRIWEYFDENNGITEVVLKKFNHKNVLEEVLLLDTLLKQTESFFKTNKYSNKEFLKFKGKVFNKLKIMKLITDLEKALEDNKENFVLLEIQEKVNFLFKNEIKKVNKPLIDVNDDLMIKRTNTIETNQSIVFNRVKKYDLSYRKSILFIDKQYIIDNEVIIEHKQYNKDIVNITFKFIKDIPDVCQKEFSHKFEEIMHKIKNQQINEDHEVSDLQKSLEEELRRALREISLKNLFEKSDIQKRLKKKL